jgi:3-hydroxyisobutyrate dehydrogenase
MGAPMATRLIDAGFRLAVHNRTRKKEIELARLGARRAATPGGVAKKARVIITMVGDTSDVEDVLFGTGGIERAAEPDTVIVDMSTIDPEATREFGTRFEKKKLHLVDAPVSGGTEGAAKGTLSIMAGGSETDVEIARVFLAPLGEVVHVGPLGSGQMAKAINQVIVGGTVLAVAEGIALGIKAGVDMEKVITAVRAGAAGSWTLDNRSERMLKGEFPLGFRIRLHKKDLDIVMKAAKRLGIDLPETKLVAELEKKLIGKGYGEEDVSALIRSVDPGFSASNSVDKVRP